MTTTAQSGNQEVIETQTLLSRRSVIRRTSALAAGLLVSVGALETSAKGASSFSAKEQAHLSVPSSEDFLGGV
jgi:hypothetical protein